MTAPIDIDALLSAVSALSRGEAVSANLDPSPFTDRRPQEAQERRFAFTGRGARELKWVPSLALECP